MFFLSLKHWDFVTWICFWFGADRNVVLDSHEIKIRQESYLKKISDLAMAWEVMVDKVYDVYEISDQDIIVDIGGHIGSYTIKAAHKCTRGHVYTFEPYLPTYTILKENVKRFKNVTIFDKAVSDHSGLQSLYISKTNPAENSLTRVTDTQTTVELISLNDIYSILGISQINLLKLDCEGAEFSILFNSKEALQKIDKIIMEVHEPKYFNLTPEFTIAKLITYLSAEGFDTHFKRENKYQGYIYAQKLTPCNAEVRY